MTRSLSASAIHLSRRAIKRANPRLNKKEANLNFIAIHYGGKLADSLRKYMKKSLIDAGLA